MRKSWPFALAVIVVGGLAGVAIAGRPVPSDTFVLDPSVTVSIPDSVPTPTPTTTGIATDAATTSVANTTGPTTTVVAVPTSNPTTAPTTTSATTTSATTTTLAGPTPRSQVRLVLANGDGRFRLSSITADRIAPLGYIVDLEDALSAVSATIVYYRAGFEDEAAIVATDISVPDATLAALPINASEAITTSDDRGDVIVVLGPDAPR